MKSRSVHSHFGPWQLACLVLLGPCWSPNLGCGATEGSRGTDSPGGPLPLLTVPAGICTEVVDALDYIARPDVGLLVGEVLSVEPVLTRMLDDDSVVKESASGLVCSGTTSAALVVTLQVIAADHPNAPSIATVGVHALITERWDPLPTLEMGSAAITWVGHEERRLSAGTVLGVAVRLLDSGEYEDVGLPLFSVAETLEEQPGFQATGRLGCLILDAERPEARSVMSLLELSRSSRDADDQLVPDSSAAPAASLCYGIASSRQSPR